MIANLDDGESTSNDARPLTRAASGRIAERLVANELEMLGFHVSSLNRDGQLANADLLAACKGNVRQIQVKGARNKSNEPWWIQFGRCTPSIATRMQPMYNCHDSFYKADIVVLVPWRSLKEYRCIVLRTEDAEAAAQISLNYDYRTPKRDGGAKVHDGPVWSHLEPSPRHDRRPPEIRRMMEECQEILRTGIDNWGTLLEQDSKQLKFSGCERPNAPI